MEYDEESMEAGYLDSPQGPLFCCYHPPQGDRHRDVAVLLCDAYGADGMIQHITYRTLALRLAEQGFPVLRLNYFSSGDSAGSPRGLAQLATYHDSLEAGAAFLLARSGAPRLSVFGALTGALIAATYATRRGDVDSLILLGAIPSGRAVLREIAALQAMMTSNPDKLAPSNWDEGDLEVAGFRLTGATVAELSSVDLTRLETLPAPRVALFHRNAAYPVEPIANRLRALGADVYVPEKPIADVSQFVNDRPTPELVNALVDYWLRSYPPAAVPLREDGQHALATAVHITTDEGLRVQEQVVRFGRDGRLFGILTQAWREDQVADAAAGLVLVNGGVNQRAGINRNHVEWARLLAPRGLAVLRMDIRGLGDSPLPKGAELPLLYRDETRDDVLDAVDYVQQELELDKIACVGLCAGGYQSLHATLADRRIGFLGMLNPLRFERSFPMHLVAAKPAPVKIHRFRKALRWVGNRVSRRLVGPASRWVVARFVTGLPSWLVAQHSRDLMVHAAPQRWLARAFLSLAKRGCRVLLVFNEQEPQLQVVRESLFGHGKTMARSGQFTIETVDGADHIFSPIFSQERVTDILLNHLVAWAHGNQAARSPKP